MGQNNSYAEAMALLQVLRWVHPAVNLQVYIDNLGALSTYKEMALAVGLSIELGLYGIGCMQS